MGENERERRVIPSCWTVAEQGSSDSQEEEDNVSNSGAKSM